MISERACEVCGSRSRSTVDGYGDSRWPLVKCDDCGFVYLLHVPGYEALDQEHAWQISHAAENARRQVRMDGAVDIATRGRLALGWWLDNLWQRNALPTSGRVLDVGCGGSCRIPDGPVPFGIEISGELVDAARPAFEARGGAVFHGPAIAGLDAFAGLSFDAILMRSYLEHEEQPRAVLEKAFRRLEPGGRIIARVPNYNSPNRVVMGRRWCGFRFPDHVNYFTGHSLRELVDGIGYRYHRANWYSLFDDNLHAVLTKPEASA